MTTNISYKLAECDLCKKQEQCDQGLSLPKEWHSLNIENLEKYDLCPDCLRKVREMISSLRRLKKLEN